MSANPHRNAHQAESITVAPAGTLAATDVQAALEELATQDAAGVTGVAAAYRLARGEATLDGTNPTPIVTGLATVVACVVTDKRADTPGDDPVMFTVDYGGGVTAGTVDLYAWKNNGTDPTLVASTDADDVVAWIAVGT